MITLSHARYMLMILFSRNCNCLSLSSFWLLSVTQSPSTFNGGQKCWDLLSNVTKTRDYFPPNPNKVEFLAKWVEMSCFFGHNIAREGAGEGKWGDYGMNPKPKKKIVARSRVLRNNYLEELFHTVPSSFVLRHCCYT